MIDERIVPKKRQPVWKKVVFFLVKVLIWFVICSSVYYGFIKFGVFDFIQKQV